MRSHPAALVIIASSISFACQTADTESIDPSREEARIYTGPVTRTYAHHYPAHDPSCVAEEEDCESADLHCCGDLFCSSELFAYGPAVCTAPQENGAFCVDDTQCDSGICRNGSCRAGQCLDGGERCDDVDQLCCEGMFCDIDPSSYGVPRCMQPFENGAVCGSNEHCASGHCVAGLCSAGECREEGAYCYDLLASSDGPPCCEGTFCALDRNFYGVATCTAAQQSGASCTANGECASQHCDAGVCQ